MAGPFDVPIELKGDPLPGMGNTDTIVRRLDDTHGLRFPEPGTDTVPIEIVQLDLVSVEPITVTFSDGSEPQQWDVRVQLSTDPEPTSLGEMTIEQTDHQGGTFDSFFDVFIDLTFTSQDDGAIRTFQWRQLGGPHKFSLVDPAPFSHLALSEMIDKLLPAGNFLQDADPLTGSRHTFIFTDGNSSQFAWRLAVPEPGSMTLLLVATLLLVCRRRRQ